MSSSIVVTKRTLLINATSSALRKAITLGVLLWMQQFLARSLTKAELDLLPLLMAGLMVFPMISNVLSAGVRRYVTEAYAQNSPERVTQVISTMMPVIVAVAAVALSLGWLFSQNVDSILDIAPQFVEEARLMFGLLIASATLRVVMTPFGLGFDVRQKFVQRNAIVLFVELFRVSLIVVLLVGLGPRVLWVIVAMVSANVLEMILVTLGSRRLAPSLRFRPSQFRPELLRPLLTFGGWSVLNQMAFQIREVADPFILNKMAMEGQAYIFYLGSLADTQLRRTYLEAYSNALPAVTALEATGQVARLRKIYFRMSRYALWILLFVTTPLVVFREEFLGLYLREKYEVYAVAATVMGLMLARTMLIFPNAILGMVAIAKARVRSIATRALVMSVINLALTLYLVGGLGLGAIGSALATFIVTALGAPLLMWSLGLQLIEVKARVWFRVSVLRGAIPAVVATPIWIGLQQYAPPPTDWLTLGLYAGAGCAAYLLVLLFFAATPTDRSDWQGYLAQVYGMVRRRSGEPARED